MSRNWYYAKDGARVGPVEFAKLKRLVHPVLCSRVTWCGMKEPPFGCL